MYLQSQPLGFVTSSLLAALVLFVTACAADEPAEEALEPLARNEATSSQTFMAMSGDDQPAPDFERETYEGGTFRLSDHRGDVVVINFWATWCMPCRVEMPEFIELQDEYGDDGLLFVGISLDQEGFDAAGPFAEEINVNYPIVVDDGEIADLYGGIYGLPATFIVDRNGDIHKRINGRIHKEDLEPMLIELLAESGA